MNYKIRHFMALVVAICLTFSSCKNDEDNPVKSPVGSNPDENKPVENKLLLKVTVANYQTSQNSEDVSWVFLSDASGKTLGAKKFKESGVIEFEKPDSFKDDKVLVSVLDFSKSLLIHSDYTSVRVNSYAVDPATEITLSRISYSQDALGTTKLTVKNVPSFESDPYHSILSVEGGMGSMLSIGHGGTDLEINHNLFKSPVKGLLSVKVDENQPPYYKFMESLEVGKEYEEEFNNLSPMENFVEFEMPEGQYHFSNLTGYTDSKFEIGTRFELAATNKRSVKLYYPKDLFKAYTSFLYYSTGSAIHFFEKKGSPATSFEKLNVTHNVSKSSVDDFEFTTTGEYDSYSFSFHFSKSDMNTVNTFVWSMTGASSSKVSGKLPEIPSEILSDISWLNRASLKPNNLSLSDYSDVDAKEYFNKMLKAESVETGDYKSSTFNMSDPQQRMSVSEESFRMEVERLRSNYRF